MPYVLYPFFIPSSKIPMTTHDPIAHHYLPVFYLNRWRGADGRIVRYYRPHERVVASRIAPSNTGFEARLHTLEGFPPEMQQAIERDYMAAIVDDRAAEAMEVLIAGDGARLTAPLREAWTRFLLSIQLRDPYSLEEIQKSCLAILRTNLSIPDDDEYNAVRKDGDPATLFEFVEQRAPHLLANIGKTFLPGLIDNKKIGTHIMTRMHWGTLDVSAGEFGLLTADRPFLRYEGLASENSRITLPLSPTRMFVAANRPDAVPRIQRTVTMRDFVRRANDDVVRRAVKHVYGDADDQLRFVEKRLIRKGATPLPGVLPGS